MEINPGYNRTEVGIIPKDWKVVNLNSVCSMKSGIGITSLNIDNFSQYQCYGGNGLRGYTKNFTHEGKFALIGRQGALCGNVVYVQGKFFASEHAIVVTPRLNNNILFLNYILKYMNLNQYSESSAQPGLSVSKILRLKLAIPAEPEQDAIAKVISDTDSLLEKLDQLIVKKQNIKQATMHQLLTGTIRLPGFADVWELKRLGDQVIKINSGGTPATSTESYYGGSIPWVSISDMTKAGKIITNTERNLTLSGFSNCSAKMYQPGTVLYAMYASLGECSIAGVQLCSSQAILGISCGPNLSNEFLYYYLNYQKSYVKSLGQQGTQSNLNKGMVENFKLPLLSISEQIAITTILSDIDIELTTLESRRQKILNLKNAIMFDLLKGKKRLKMSDKINA
jgi:type I restriction enzyme S subunit